MSNSTHIMGYGPDGPQGDNKSGYTASATGSSGPTGATGPAGGIGLSGPTGFGFGFSGNNTDRTQWEYAVIGDDNNSLTFFLGGSADSQIPGKDDSLTITGLRGPTGTTGTDGQLFIQTLVTGASGAILLKGISGSSADFKTINSRSDVTITVSNDTITLTGISANSADSIDAGRTGEILVMVREDYADGATGTFFNLSAYPTPDTSTNASLDTLSLQKVGNQREIIKRHGTPAAPVGYKSNERVDINISYDDANVHLIHCGPTTGFINFPDPSEISNIGTTYGRQEELTIILHRGKSHGIVAGDIPNDFCQSMFRPSVVNFAIFNGYRSNIFSSGGSKLPYCENIGGGPHSNSPCKLAELGGQPDLDLTCTKLTSDFAAFGGDGGQRTVIEDEENAIGAVYYQEGSNTATGTKLLKDLKFSDGYDIFTFSSIQGKWVINNPTLGITADSRFSLSKTNTGSCCEFNNAGDYLRCNDYITEIECDSALLGPEVFSVRFTPFTLCESSDCDSDGLGACCTMGNCVQSNRETCNIFSGFFVPNAICGQGGLDCNGYPCDTPILPTGACCLQDSDGCYSCIDVTEDQCALCGGDFKGYDTPCSADPCPTSPPDCKYGACCSYSPLNPGVRQCNEVTEKTCLESCLTGLYYGDDSTCCATRYPRDGIYVGAFCDGNTVQVVYGASTEEVNAQIPSDVDDACKNVILWNTNSPYPESWLPGFATQPGSGVHEPSVSQGVCQAADLGSCPGCNCQEQAATMDDEILGTCCLPYRVPVGEFSCDYIPNYDLQTCEQVGGTWYNETPEELGIDCASGIDCNSAGTEGDAPDCVDCDVKGACCFGGNCEYLSGDECDALGGEFQGEGTNCDTVECCNQITGPCCLNDGICIETHPYNCNQLGGVFNGIGLSCDDPSFNCCTHQDVEDVRGACCCSGCPCTENLTAAECQAKNGTDGCSDCTFYLDTGCFDIPCIDDCTDECLSEPENRASWHIFTLSAEYGGETSFDSGPYSWGNTNLNPSATNVDDVEYLPPITRSQDGFYNTHGWYWSWGVGDDDANKTCEWNTPTSIFERNTTIMRKSGPLTYAGFVSDVNPDSRNYYTSIIEKYWDDDDDPSVSSFRDTNYGIAQGGLAYSITTIENDTNGPNTIWNALRTIMNRSPQNLSVYSPAGHISNQHINPIFQRENLYIPSKQELHFYYYQRELYSELRTRTSYVSGNVWSSSVASDDTTYAFYQSMDDGKVGVHKVMNIENPNSSWPNNDQESVQASAVFFYRVMVGSKEYEDNSTEIENFVPGQIVQMGTTNSKTLVYVGKFTPGCNQVFGTSSDDISQFSNVDTPRNGTQVCSNKLPEGSCCDCDGCDDNSANQYTCLHRKNGETWPDHSVDKIKAVRVKRWKADNIGSARIVQYNDSSSNPVTRLVDNVNCGTSVKTPNSISPFFWACDDPTESTPAARNYYSSCLEIGICCDTTNRQFPTYTPECQCVGPTKSWTDINEQIDVENDPVTYCGYTEIKVSTCCTRETQGGPVISCEENVLQGDCDPILGTWNNGESEDTAPKSCAEVNCVEEKGSCCFVRDITTGDGDVVQDYECSTGVGYNGNQLLFESECINPTTRNAILQGIGVPSSIVNEFRYHSINAGNVNCSTNPCPTDTTGTCCKYEDNGDPIDSNNDGYVDCEVTTYLDCINESPNNLWNNNGAGCGDPQFPQFYACPVIPDEPELTGACCVLDTNDDPTGSCSIKTAAECAASNDEYQGNGVPCVDGSGNAQCVPPDPPPTAGVSCCDDNGDGIGDYICVDLPQNTENGSFDNDTGACSFVNSGLTDSITFTTSELENSPYGIYMKNNIKTVPDIMSYGCPCSWFDINAFGTNERFAPDVSFHDPAYGRENMNLTYTAHSPSDCMWIKNYIDPPQMEIDYHGGGSSDRNANACQINCCELGKYTIDNLSKSVNNFTEQHDQRAVHSGGYIYQNPLPLMELIPTNSQSSYYPVNPADDSLVLFTLNGLEPEQNEILKLHHLRQAHWDIGWTSDPDDLNTRSVFHSAPLYKNYNQNSTTQRFTFSFINKYKTPADYNVGAWINASQPSGEGQTISYGYNQLRTAHNIGSSTAGYTETQSPPQARYGKYASKAFEGISGVSTNRMAYACVPYKGIFDQDGENWWTGTTSQNYRWELPDQRGETNIKALNPSMARSVSFRYQTYGIPDHFQIVQLPWPKGARNKEEAQERIRLYLRALNTQVFTAPVRQAFDFQDANSEWRKHWEDNENTNKERNMEDPLWILQDPFRTGGSGRLNVDAGDGGPQNSYDYLNGIMMTNRPLHSNSSGDFYPTKSVISTQGGDSRGSIVGREPNDNTNMLYHGRESFEDGARSIAEKYLGWKAEENWVLFDSGCISTDAKQGCAPLLYPYCSLRLDSKQIEMTHKGGGNINVEREIQKRMLRGYGPSGQGPIAPIVIGISACSLEQTWFEKNWPDWVGQGLGSVYDVQMGSCGGGTVTFNGNGDNSAVGVPGNQNGTDCNQTSCGDRTTPVNTADIYTISENDIELSSPPSCGS